MTGPFLYYFTGAILIGLAALFVTALILVKDRLISILRLSSSCYYDMVVTGVSIVTY